MNIAEAREFLLWCTVLNYGVLLLWWGIFTLAHDGQYRLVKRLLSRSFSMSMERMDEIQFGAIALYKVGLFLFNVVPLIALYILR